MRVCVCVNDSHIWIDSKTNSDCSFQYINFFMYASRRANGVIFLTNFFFIIIDTYTYIKHL